MEKNTKPDWAIKFRNFCYNNDLRATDIAELLHVQLGTVYKYWSGHIAVPDSSKKILEKEAGLDIYETFYEEL